MALDYPLPRPTLASHPHSIPQHWWSSVLAHGGRVWRLGTALCATLWEFE